MSNITVTENTVKMTIEYCETFTTEAEMFEAVSGAVELRGLCSKSSEEAPNDGAEGII